MLVACRININIATSHNMGAHLHLHGLDLKISIQMFGYFIISINSTHKYL
jgi:hypothetical protein